MGAGHAHPLYHHGHTLLHRLPPEVKVAGTFGFVLGVALTPRYAVWAFGVDALLLLVLLRVARLPLRFVLGRLAVVAPFVLFAVLIPFIAGGERTPVLGIAVSREGLWASFNVLAKAGLGATASILLAGTTEQATIVKGLERLRVPVALTTIASFMLRYLELLASELGRMRTAMSARGYDPRWLWQVRPMASAAGAMFVRSYERGERVHAAMLSRGYTGTMPELGLRRATTNEWTVAAVAPVLSLGLALISSVLP